MQHVPSNAPLLPRLRRFLLGALVSVLALFALSKLYVVGPIREEVVQRLDWDLASEIAAELERNVNDSEATQKLSSWLTALRPGIRVLLLDSSGRSRQIVPSPQVEFAAPIPLAPIVAATGHAIPRLPIRLVDPASGDPVIFSAARLSAQWNAPYLVALPPEPYAPLAATDWLRLLVGDRVVGATIMLYAVVFWLVISLFTRWILAPVRAVASAFSDAVRSPEDASALQLGTFKELDRLLYSEATTLVARHKRLEAQELQDRTFMARFVHDLRTPFTALLGFLQLLNKPTDSAGAGIDEARDTRYLNNIALALDRVDEQLKPLREFAAMSDLAASFAPKQTDFAELARDSVMLFERLAESSQISLSLQLDESLPQLSADRGLLSRVISNLLSNALRYTPKGGAVTLTVRRSSLVPEPSQPVGVTIAVHDTGVGISSEHIAHLGEEFYRVNNDHTLSTDSGGTGLGLANVRAILKLHQCDLNIVSTVGKGSTFSFTITPPVAAELPAGSTLRNRLGVSNAPSVARASLALFAFAVCCAEILIYFGTSSIHLERLELLALSTCGVFALVGFDILSGAVLRIAVPVAMAIIPSMSGRPLPELANGSMWYGLLFSAMSATLLALPVFKPLRTLALCSLIVAIVLREYFFISGTISFVMILALPAQLLVYQAYHAGSYTRYVNQAALGLFGTLWALGSLLLILFYIDLADRLRAQSVRNQPAANTAAALSLIAKPSFFEGLDHLSLFAPGSLFLVADRAQQSAKAIAHYDGAEFGAAILLRDDPTCPSARCVTLYRPATEKAAESVIRSGQRFSVDTTSISQGRTLLVAPFASSASTILSRICQGALAHSVALPYFSAALLAALLLRNWLKREVTIPLRAITSALSSRDVSGVDPSQCSSIELRAVSEGMRDLYFQLTEAETKLNAILARRRTLVASFADALGQESVSCRALLLQIKDRDSSRPHARELLAKVQTITGAMTILFDFACAEAKPPARSEGMIDVAEIVYETQLDLDALGFPFQIQDASGGAVVSSVEAAALAVALRTLVVGLVLISDSNCQLRLTTTRESGLLTVRLAAASHNRSEHAGFKSLVGALQLDAAQSRLAELSLPVTRRSEGDSVAIAIAIAETLPK